MSTEPTPVPATEHRAFRILQLTDTHIGVGGAPHNSFDTVGALLRVLDRAAHTPDIDLVAVTGDVSNDGTEDSYRRVHEILLPWIEARGVPVVYAMGNHDGRAAFRSVLVPASEQPDVAGPAADAPVYGAFVLNGVRIVVLDSSVPGHSYGAIDDDQAAWLREELSEPAERGTVVVVHHPPVPAATELMNGLRLRRPEVLADAIDGSDVRVILSGHNHHALITTFGGALAVMGAPVTAQADPLGDPGIERARFGSGATLVEIAGTSTAFGAVRVIPFTAPSPRDGEHVFTLDTRDVERVIAGDAD